MQQALATKASAGIAALGKGKGGKNEHPMVGLARGVFSSVVGPSENKDHTDIGPEHVSDLLSQIHDPANQFHLEEVLGQTNEQLNKVINDAQSVAKTSGTQLYQEDVQRLPGYIDAVKPLIKQGINPLAAPTIQSAISSLPSRPTAVTTAAIEAHKAAQVASEAAAAASKARAVHYTAPPPSKPMSGNYEVGPPEARTTQFVEIRDGKPFNAAGEPMDAATMRNARLVSPGEATAQVRTSAPPTNPNQVLLAKPGVYTSEQIKTAQKLVDQKNTNAALLSHLTPAAIETSARRYHDTGGELPSGMGKEGWAIKAAVMNKEAEMYPGSSLAGNKADFTGFKSALTSLDRQAALTGAFEKTAESNLDIALANSNRVDRTGSPIINKYLLKLKGDYAGDDDTKLLENAVITAANEYGKVISGSTSGQVTDAAKQEAKQLLNEALAKGTFAKVAAQMKQEMGNRRLGFDTQRQELQRAIVRDPDAKTEYVFPDGHKISGTKAQVDAYKADVEAAQKAAAGAK